MGLGDRVRDTLTEWAQIAFNFLTAPLRDAFDGWSENLLKQLEQEIAVNTRRQLELWREVPGLPSETREVIERLLNPPGPVWGIIGAMVLGIGVQPLLAAGLTPVMRIAEQTANTQIPNAAITPAEAITSFIRGHWDEGRLRGELRLLGLNDERVNALVAAVRPLLAVGELRDLLLRGMIDEGEHDRRMHQMGYTDDTIALFKRLYFWIPGPGDLVRMAVREAFTPEAIEKFQLHSDFPPPFGDWLAKTGGSEEWARAYWAAHWELPSLGQGFEMFQRGELASEDLDLLMRMQDILPFFRPKLKAIAYNPLTRVDVRRMYRLGVLDAAAVKKSYQDIGYSPENAQLMTDFTIKFEHEPERDLSRSDIIGGYKERLLGRDQTVDLLKTLFFSEEEIEFLLAKADYEITKKKVDDTVSGIRRSYVYGIIDEGAARGRLGRLGLSAEQMEELIRTWDIERERDIQRPSPSNLETFFKQQVISENSYREQMQLQGYSPEIAEWFIRSTLYELQLEAEKRSRSELERQQRAVKVPSRSDLRSFYLEGIMTEGAIRQELERQKFTLEYIDNLLALWNTEAEAINTARTKRELQERLKAIAIPSKSDLRAFLNAGLIPEDEVREALKKQRYTETDIERYLAIFIKGPSVGQLSRQYLDGIIGEPDLLIGLGKQGYNEETANNIIADLDYQLEQAALKRTEAEQKERQRMVKRASKADLKAFLKLGLITVEEFREELLAQGYLPEWVELFVKQVTMPKPPE